MPRSAAALTSPVRTAVFDAAAQVLGVSRLEPDSNFFDLGGSSLSVALLTERLEGVLGTPCPMGLLYEHPVLTDFADAVQRLVQGAEP